ncbi:hypothetical protein DFJ73DRAFT_916151 [Zopfochytrium polystomum]|nr:hypothetical protein DFJ73DRAFT_916151 [Zopfochytrium polystomum]
MTRFAALLARFLPFSTSPGNAQGGRQSYALVPLGAEEEADIQEADQDSMSEAEKAGREQSASLSKLRPRRSLAFALLIVTAVILTATGAILTLSWPPSKSHPREHDHTHSVQKIALLTVAFGSTEWYYKPSIANKLAYATRHGYDLIVLDQPERDQPPLYAVGDDPTPHPVWAKVSGLRRHVYDYDWILVVDADAFVANQEVRVEDFVETIQTLHLAQDAAAWWHGRRRRRDRVRRDPGEPEKDAEEEEKNKEKKRPRQRLNVTGPPPPLVLPWPTLPRGGPRAGPDVIIAMDCNGINAGTFLLRGARGSRPASPPISNSFPSSPTTSFSTSTTPHESRPPAVQLLDFWLAREPMPDVHRNGLMEQEALRTAIDANVLDVRRRVAAVPLRLMNAYPSGDCVDDADPYYPNYVEGDWIIHFVHTTKATMRERLSAMGLL